MLPSCDSFMRTHQSHLSIGKDLYTDTVIGPQCCARVRFETRLVALC